MRQVDTLQKLFMCKLVSQHQVCKHAQIVLEAAPTEQNGNGLGRSNGDEPLWKACTYENGFGRGVSTHITYAVRDSGWSVVYFAAR